MTSKDIIQPCCLHKIYNKQDLPWVELTWKHLYRNHNKAPHECRPKGSFWWRSIIRLASNFFMLASYEVNEGSTVSFWNDQWNQRILKTEFPQLHSFSIKKDITVKGFLTSTTQANFWLPLSLQASAQLAILQEEINNMHLDPNQQDQWLYIWGSALFSSKKAYLQLIGTLDASPWFKWLWNSGGRGKHKSFFWLLLRDRVNTQDMIQRKNMHLDDYTCVLCHSNHDETLIHLFFECSFSQWCWGFLNIT